MPDEFSPTGTRILEMLGAAVAGDAHAAATTLTRLGESSTENQMYGVCCSIAAAGEHALNLIYGDRAPQSAGDMWAMQLTPGALNTEPSNAWACRFLVAQANGDRDQTLALYGASLDSPDDRHVANVCALLIAVAGLLRLAQYDTTGGAR